MNRSLLRLILAGLALFTLTDCFQILHYLRLNPDGTVSVTWRFSMAAAMRKQMSEKKESSKGGPNVAGDITKSIFDKTDALSALLNKSAKGVTIRLLESEYDVTQEVTFSAPAGAPIPTHDGLPVFPSIDTTKKAIIFDFVPLAEKNKKKQEGKEEKKENPQAEKIAGLFLSTARYQVVLDNFAVTSAFIENAKTGKRVAITPTPLGNLTMVDFPFLTALSMEKDGFRLLLKYR